MSDDKLPDTTAIRAFAAGLRTSVGIRSELLASHSHLLALCDALDVERAATANKPPPRRVPEEKDGSLSDNECAFLRKNYGGAGGLSAYWGGRLFATLDAERAANAEMRRALERADEVLQRIRTRIVQAPTRDLPGVLLHDATDDLTHRAQQSVRAALRAAEKAPETTEPARLDADRTALKLVLKYEWCAGDVDGMPVCPECREECNGGFGRHAPDCEWGKISAAAKDAMTNEDRKREDPWNDYVESRQDAPPAGDGLTAAMRDADDFAKYIADGERPGKDHACARCVPYESGTIQDFVCVRHRALDRVRAAAEKASTR